jgi:metal-dependent amidase/aminoacylase/carboxypeptidase family protein
MENIDKSLFSLESLIEFRHWMHENAELSWNEYNTVAKIREYLT